MYAAPDKSRLPASLQMNAGKPPASAPYVNQGVVEAVKQQEAKVQQNAPPERELPSQYETIETKTQPPPQQMLYEPVVEIAPEPVKSDLRRWMDRVLSRDECSALLRG